MAVNEFMLVIGMIIVGLIFFMIAQGFIFGELKTTKEDMYKAEAEGIVSLIQRTTSEQGNYFYYFKEISLSNVSVKNGVLNYQKDNLKFLYTLPKEVKESDLTDVSSVCVLKKNGTIELLEKCPKCNMDSICSPDECKENCQDCYGPSSVCVGDGYCNKPIGESCENSIADCPCTSGVCCPPSSDSDNHGCSNIKNVPKGNECWCSSQCESGLDCDPTAPNFAQYKKACCTPGKGWNGTDCVEIECPKGNECPGAPMNGEAGDHAWTDISGKTCCPLGNIGDISGPVCSSSHCCPTHKSLWCSKPKTGSPRCVDNTEFVNEKCEEICPSTITQCFNKWHWSNYDGTFHMNPESCNPTCYDCDFFETCQSPVVQPIAKEIIECCNNKCSGNCHSLCNKALSDSGLSSTDTPETRKKCYGLYTLYGLGPAARWMQGYQIHWEEPASIMLSGQTWMCTGYSIAVTTLLRSVGYGKDEAYSICGPGHAYNLVKFPGDTKYHLVDTVGNLATPYNPTGVPPSGYPYCSYGGCTPCLMNDEGGGPCPPRSEVVGC
jgi:hypothetical protein